MALSINGPATSAPGGFASAVRNPSYTNGVLTGSSATPGGPPTLPVPATNPLGPSQTFRGNPRALLQAILMNRADPYQNLSMEEEELRKSAMRRLRG